MPIIGGGPHGITASRGFSFTWTDGTVAVESAIDIITAGAIGVRLGTINTTDGLCVPMDLGRLGGVAFISKVSEAGGTTGSKLQVGWTRIISGAPVKCMDTLPLVLALVVIAIGHLRRK